MLFRMSTEEEIPVLKTLWKLGFGDEGAYVENFFRQFAKPLYVAEESGEIVAMTAVFDSTFHYEGQGYLFGYLYAVTTHPDQEKKGIASGLLAYIYEDLAKMGYAGVTTVPATPSLHGFFGRNGFQDYFDYGSLPCGGAMGDRKPISTEDYLQKREEIMAQWQKDSNCGYISLHLDGFAYQKSVCDLGEGGFFWSGEQLMAVEQATEGAVVVKECLSLSPCTVGETYGQLSVLEGRGLPQGQGDYAFGMIQWFVPSPLKDSGRGYLGFAFD